MDTAYFVQRPETVFDLIRPHPLELERPYEITKTVALSAMAYENFATDMLAERLFLVDSSPLHDGSGAVWRCLLVKRRGGRSGILVLPEHGGHVGWAAYYTGA